MKNILKKKSVWYVMLALLFVFMILVGFHFFKVEEAKKKVDVNPIILPEEDEFDFINHTSLSKEEIVALVTSKKNAFSSLFYESNVYELKEIDASRTAEDNEKYIVFDETFLEKLASLVSESKYYEIFNLMTLLKNDGSHTFYLMEKNAFDFIYLDSAIAKTEVTKSFLRVISASDERINASVTLTICHENECGDKHVPFELEKISGDWKISVFE